jgi:phospholipase/carboxylesterase
VLAQETKGGALDYISLFPDRYDETKTYPLIVLLHGFGASMYDLAGLAPALDDEGYVYACPNAPHSVELGGGMTGYSWYEGMRGMPPPANPGPPPEHYLERFFAELAAHRPFEAGRALLAGFSQGGGLALRYGLPRPETFAGVVVLSGAPRNLEEIDASLPAKRDLPVFVAHGSRDPMVPLERAQGTKAFLEERGYQPSYHEYQMGHEITPGLIRDLVPWLHETLPPSGG